MLVHKISMLGFQFLRSVTVNPPTERTISSQVSSIFTRYSIQALGRQSSSPLVKDLHSGSMPPALTIAYVGTPFSVAMESQVSVPLTTYGEPHVGGRMSSKYSVRTA